MLPQSPFVTNKKPSLDIRLKFDNLVLMENGNHISAVVLEKKAVTAALQQNWKLSIDLNLQLLEKNPKDIKAKTRLGRAYLQTKDFTKAAKIFKEVLQADPVNAIAKKNLELAKSKKADKVNGDTNTSKFIKEPGTSAMEIIELTARNLTYEDFDLREELDLKINKASVNVLRKNKVIGKIINPDLVKRLNLAKSKRANISISFYNGKRNTIKVLLRSDVPVFKAERQELKPYMKKGSIDEPEVEMATTEETSD